MYNIRSHGMFFIIFDHANACASMHLLVTSSTPTLQSQLTATLKMKDSEDVLTIFEGTLEKEKVNRHIRFYLYPFIEN